MSLVMAYFLFCMIFIHKQECAAIRYHHNQNALEYVIQKYMNPLRRLSSDLPNHAIEMEIEIHGSVPREATNDPRRFIRLINPRRPKPILRAQDGAEGEEVTADGTATTAIAPDPGQATAAPAAGAAGAGVVTVPGAHATGAAGASAVSGPGAPALAAGTDAERSDPQKIPVFMEDLKKALDDLEKKLIPNPENSAAVTITGPPNLNAGVAAPQASSQPVRSIDDIVQLLKKAIHVEHRMPKAGDEKLEWVQIKIPKSMQL